MNIISALPAGIPGKVRGQAERSSPAAGGVFKQQRVIQTLKKPQFPVSKHTTRLLTNIQGFHIVMV